jgi:hypothetical protein
MHACPACGDACDCDVEDHESTADYCLHVCADDDGDDWIEPDYDDEEDDDDEDD